ncbi:FtsX-like permease family protein [Glaciihabitans sp. dw_435]|uniref:FtsX-like permease family protein n=1 Tax=Glaciihabitans sp. dw_435 TaxID=2720081 RepID=UPI001BD45B67|nr:FtsX-like permease family protein [Glaciihabitans sp. dw_435]
MAIQAPGRSALIALLVAIPIIGISAVATVGTSSQATRSEIAQTQLGQMQAVITVNNPPDPTAVQDPDQPDNMSYAMDESGMPLRHSFSDPLLPIDQILQSGTPYLPIEHTSVTVRTAAGLGSMTAVLGEPWNPSFAGRYDVIDGTRPNSPSEVMVTPTALKRLGISIGGTMSVVTPAQASYTVVGTLRDSVKPSATQEVFGAVAPMSGDSLTTNYYLPHTELDWPAVQKLNTKGAGVLSSYVLEHPRPAAPGPANPLADAVAVGAAIALFGAFALFEVGLLAGAAFMVGARQQQRALAILSSVGGDRRMLFRVVSFGGLVLGAVGGAAGVVVGIIGAWVFTLVTADGSSIQYPGFHVNAPLLVGVALFAVVVGWLSAIIPARAASRVDVVASLRGSSRPPVPTARKPIVGIILVAIGFVSALAGGIVTLTQIRQSYHGTSYWGVGIALIALGPILMQVGVMFLSPFVLRVAARLLSPLGAGARLGARDAARNPGRSVPALAAIMSTVFVASALMTTIGAYQTESASDYQYTTANNTARVNLYRYDFGGQNHVDPAGSQIAAALNASFHVTSARVLSSAPTTAGTVDKDQLTYTAPRLTQLPDASSTNFYLSSTGLDQLDKIWVGSPADLAAILGEPVSATSRTSLESGGVVSLYPDYISSGKVTIDWFTDSADPVANGTATPVRSVALPATLQEPVKPISFGMFMTPATARSIKLDYVPTLVLAPLASAPSFAETDAARAQIDDIAGVTELEVFQVETGPPPVAELAAWGILILTALIVLGASSVALSLARADGRRDDAVLGALGSPPNLRRSIGFWQAIVIAGVGTVIGVAFGLVPPLALSLPPADGTLPLLPFSPPWLQLILAATAVPLVIAVGSWLTARGSRLRVVTRSTW